MKKTNDYYGTLYAGIAMNVKTSIYYGILYVGIAMNVKH
jgi:predicted GIY-YIG superfamily endonuclease